jgi:hypothetical protein
MISSILKRIWQIKKRSMEHGTQLKIPMETGMFLPLLDLKMYRPLILFNFNLTQYVHQLAAITIVKNQERQVIQ